MTLHFGALHQIIEAEKEAYHDQLRSPHPDWPVDVRVLYEALQQRVFQQGLRVDRVRNGCGLRNRNVSTRFKHYVGIGPKAYVLYHRIELAKRLLRHKGVSVTQIAFAVGYELPNAFTETFKRWVGKPPTAYRACYHEESEDKNDV